MRTHFKLFSLAALALTVGLTSCSKKNDPIPAPGGDKDIVVKMNFSGGKSKAASDETAVGQAPTLTRLALIFTDATNVLKVEEVDLTGADKAALESAGGKPFTVPNAVTRLYAVGNYGAGPGLGSPTIPSVGNTVASVEALALELDKQDNGYKTVNLSAGQADLTTDDGGKIFTGGGSSVVGTTETYSLNIVPAFARYEIKKVSLDNTADQKLKSFKLTGIFISNTYRTIGLDYATVATAPADIFNFGPNTTDLDGDVPSYLQDALTPAAAGTSFTPNTFDGGISATNGFWHYMVASPIAGKGTTLDGGSTQESSVPVIILRITDVEAVDGSNITYPGTHYVTVRKLIPTTGADQINPLTYLRPGFVYTIDDIAIGGEHLTGQPGDNSSDDIAVKVTFKPWQGQPVKPAL